MAISLQLPVGGPQLETFLTGPRFSNVNLVRLCYVVDEELVDIIGADGIKNYRFIRRTKKGQHTITRHHYSDSYLFKESACLGRCRDKNVVTLVLYCTGTEVCISQCGGIGRKCIEGCNHDFKQHDRHFCSLVVKCYVKFTNLKGYNQNQCPVTSSTTKADAQTKKRLGT